MLITIKMNLLLFLLFLKKTKNKQAICYREALTVEVNKGQYVNVKIPTVSVSTATRSNQCVWTKFYSENIHNFCISRKKLYIYIQFYNFVAITIYP